MSLTKVLFLALVGLSAAAPSTLKPRAGDTENDLTNGNCLDMMVIFARGTTETGNVGTLTGPPFFSALDSTMGAGKVAVQGVEYPADIPGFLAGGDANGSATMAKLVQQSLSTCPNSKIVMSGYSQGGQLVHNAATMLGTTMSKVNSVVIFGDPDDGTDVAGIDQSKVKVICHTGDNICAHGDLILTPHLTYSMNAQQAATFVQQQAAA